MVDAHVLHIIITVLHYYIYVHTQLVLEIQLLPVLETRLIFKTQLLLEVLQYKICSWQNCKFIFVIKFWILIVTLMWLQEKCRLFDRFLVA